MTKEEAIEWFKDNPFMNKTHTPFLMAIKALEQPEVIRCKDCKFYIGEGHYCKIRGLGRALKPDNYCCDGKKD